MAEKTDASTEWMMVDPTAAMRVGLKEKMRAVSWVVPTVQMTADWMAVNSADLKAGLMAKLSVESMVVMRDG